MRTIASSLLARIRSAYWMARLRWDARTSGGTLRLDPSLRLRTRTVFLGRGTLVIEANVVLGDAEAGLPGAPILLAPRTVTARIAIGPGARLTNGTELIALECIEMGADCLVGPGVRIVDADFHGVGLEERHNAGRSAAVRIEDSVWIGMGAMVLKGVHIGTGVVIGAGAVVVRDVPALAVSAGNPARLVASVAANG